MEPKKVEIKLSSGDSNPIPAVDLINVIDGFQDLVYGVAKMKAAYPLDKKGPLASDIKNVCEVLITNVRPGSIILEVTAREPELNLFGYDTFANEIFNTGEDVLRSMATGDTKELIRLLPEDKYRKSILKNAQKFIPKDDSDTVMSMSSQGGDIMQIRRLDKEKLQTVIPSDKKQKEIIRTKIADIKGLALVDENDQFKDFQTIFKMSEIPGISLDHVAGREYKYSFVNELVFGIQEEEDLHIITNEKLNILIYIPKSEDILQSIGNEIDFLWAEYAEENDDNLHDSGKRLKTALLQVVSERSIV